MTDKFSISELMSTLMKHLAIPGITVTDLNEWMWLAL